MEDKNIDVSEFNERFHEAIVLYSRDYSDLSLVRLLIHCAWGNNVDEIEILKVEDDLIDRGIIPRRVEYEDSINEYIYEGDEIIRDIKFYLWNVLYEERREREYEERLQKFK